MPEAETGLETRKLILFQVLKNIAWECGIPNEKGGSRGHWSVIWTFLEYHINQCKFSLSHRTWLISNRQSDKATKFHRAQRLDGFQVACATKQTSSQMKMWSRPTYWMSLTLEEGQGEEAEASCKQGNFLQCDLRSQSALTVWLDPRCNLGYLFSFTWTLKPLI